GELGALAVQVRYLRHVSRLQHPAVYKQQLVTGRGELLDGGPAYEPRAAEDDDPQALALALPFVSGAFAACGFFSTMRSTRPQSLACSGVMKKSRSIARSTSSSGRPQCLA